MKNAKLTDAFILDNSNPSDIKLSLSLSHLEKFKKKLNLLVIQSTTESCSRITIYPLDKKSIIKISLSGSNISDENIGDLSKLIKKYKIIHTSGLLIKGEDLFYECYLKLDLSDDQTKDLKASLDNFRNIFKEIRIEEIGLKESKTSRI
jgi:hypothetical protein